METPTNIADLKTAFEYKNNRELKFTWYIFSLIQHPKLVKILTYLADFGIKYKLPIKTLIKQTVFKVFCSGENVDEAFGTIKKLHKFNVKSVLDYVSEAEKSNEAYDLNTKKIINNINTVREGTKSDFISVKMSGLEDPDYLTSLSESQFFFADKRFGLLHKRIQDICSAAAQNNIMVYIDAEETWMQYIIDHFAEEMMLMFNKQKVVVFNTLQMYRTDRVQYLKDLLDEASKKGFKPGIKLVRGAYLEKETLKAVKAGKPIPVFQTKADTDRAFNEAVDICLAAHDQVCTCIATHNEESIQYGLKQIDKYHITDHQSKVQFSQLFGMSDHLTFNLAANGFHASKYLPYGEVEKAIPYLMRRAEENTSINGQMGREVKLLGLELKRRNS